MGYNINRGSWITIKICDKIVTDSEFSLFINTYPYLCRDRIIWELMYWCGLRLIDTVRLQYFNFSDEYKKLEYFPAKKKNPSLRTVYLPDWLAAKLKEYVNLLGPALAVNGGFIFPSIGHGCKEKYVSASSLRTFFQRRRMELINQKQFFFLKDYYEIVYDPKTQQRIMRYRFAPHAFRAVYNTTSIQLLSKIKKEKPELDINDVPLTAKEVLGYDDLTTLMKYHRIAIKDQLLQAIVLERKKSHTLQEQATQPIG